MNLVSIVIPTYNRADMLPRAVDSALRQSGCEIEAIVVDDGSTDATRRIAGELGSRVRYVYQDNAGACAARNRGLELARGEFVKFLDSDDILEPDSVAAQIRTLEETGAEVSYGMWGEFGDRDAPEGLPAATMPHENPVDSLLDNWWCANFAYLFRRKAIENLRWDSALHSAQDFDFALQVAFSGARFVHTAVMTGRYYQHAGGRVSRRNISQWTRDRERVFSKARQRLSETHLLTPPRAHWLALNYFRLAQTAYSLDRARFRELIALTRETEPGFLPPRRFHALAVRVFGFEKAEYVLEIRRHLRRRGAASA